MFSSPPPQDTIQDAARRGDLEAFCNFIKRDGFFNGEDDIGEPSLLTVACGAGQVEVVRHILFLRGKYRGDFEYSPEAFAAMRGDHVEVLRLLCERGLPPDAWAFHNYGDPLLATAVDERRVEVVRLLLEYGGVIYSDPEHELTAEEYEIEGDYPSSLELAARAGDVEFVTFLLEVGYDLGGQTPDYYLSKAQSNVAKYEQCKKDEPERGSWDRVAALSSPLRDECSDEESGLFEGCLVQVCKCMMLGAFMALVCWIVERLVLFISSSLS